MKNRHIAALLVFCLTVSCLAGCVGNFDRDTGDEQPKDAVTSPSADDGGAGEDTVAGGLDFDKAYGTYDPDEVMLTVNGLPVSWGEYFYWYYSAIAYIEYYEYYYFGLEGIQDLSGICQLDGELTYAEYAKNYAELMCTQYKVFEYNGQVMGVTLNDDDLALLEETYASDVETYSGGDEQAFAEYLGAIYLDMQQYTYINRQARMAARILEEMYGKNGEEFTDEDTLAFAEEYSYTMVKQILVSTLDENGSSLLGEELQERRDFAQSLLDQLRAVEGGPEALEALFDELMMEYTEDTGIEYYPDGYCFLSGEMIEAFEEAAYALGEYEVSDLVESSYGEHIILRLPIDPDCVVEYYDAETKYTLRYLAAADTYDTIVAGWAGDAVCEYSDNYKSIDFAGIFRAQ